MKHTHGGKRKGAGRKPNNIPTVVINFRVPEDRKDELKKKMKTFLEKCLQNSK